MLRISCSSSICSTLVELLADIEIYSGKAIALRLAAEGFRVCVNDISLNQEAIDSVVAEIVQHHGKDAAIGVAADVTQSREVQAMVDATVRKLGSLTIMIANAGISKVRSVLELTEADVRETMDINFMGVFHCYQAAAKQMIAQGPRKKSESGYRIIGAASIMAFKAQPLSTHYTASKWAVRGMTHVFAMELAKHSITVNAYAPGIIGTPMWKSIREGLEERNFMDKKTTLEDYASNINVMGRLGAPEDVANVVGGFLTGPNAAYLTGQTIVVDGGIVFT